MPFLKDRETQLPKFAPVNWKWKQKLHPSPGEAPGRVKPRLGPGAGLTRSNFLQVGTLEIGDERNSY